MVLADVLPDQGAIFGMLPQILRSFELTLWRIDYLKVKPERCWSR